MDDFPVPIRFDLPGPHWRALPPTALGVCGARFLAVRERTPGGYTPTLTLAGGWRTDEATLAQIADEALGRLRRETPDVRLRHRRETGTDRAPGLSQVLDGTLEADGRTLAITRLQALLGLVDVAEPARRAVLILTCTSLTGQVELVGPEFRRLVSGVRLDEAPPAGG